MAELFFVNSLEKVFPDEKPSGELKSFSMLKGERYSFQLVIRCESEHTPVLITLPEELASCVHLYTVGLIPVNVEAEVKCRDDFLLKEGKIGEYPDLLTPCGSALSLYGKGYRSVWLEIVPDADIFVGRKEPVFTVELPDEKYTLSLQITVIPAELAPQKLICTHWFHCDCLAEQYGVSVFSEEHWNIIENYIRFAVAHGINFILTPLFTPPLDTAVGSERPTVQLVLVNVTENGYAFNFDLLDRWIDMCLRAGVEYFEMSHLFTQWGAKHAPKIVAQTDDGIKRIFGWETDAHSAEYTNFLRAFAAALKPYLEKKGIKDRCFFHVSDEPSEQDYESYKKTAELIGELFGEYKCIDALSEYVFYEKGLTKTPIPSIASIDDFVGKVPELWTYYCGGPTHDRYINRFLYFPSVRNRALGVALYKYDCKGFLHWGYNFWYTVLSTAKVDPYKDTASGGGFPAGDGFVVYPGENGKPLPSVRLKVFYEALQDERALRLLESLAGREKTLEILESVYAGYAFNRYPTESADFLSLRETINSAILSYCS